MFRMTIAAALVVAASAQTASAASPDIARARQTLQNGLHPTEVKACKKGKPCGNACIAQDKTCRK
ncbi:hypothetical protein [Paenirhodobacter enshiensis]|uniref:Uncharacterized protein n=1 Tax=Paenirhodobacter enshiensis TaxID=1105367 RepID=A0A086Y2F5_9RHOB|nr:hypothetical protein [Paenirhodobacter enshiensis]KFI28455.1 hypothetical protein CG50_13655 [Paenirhodobacter enshiensis]